MTINLNVPPAVVNALKSWRSSVAGLAALVLAAYNASAYKSFTYAIHDPHFQTFVIVGLLGLIVKDSGQG